MGHFVSALGPIGDKSTETTTVLLEHDIATADFSKAVLACLPKNIPWRVSPEDMGCNRLDLRSIPVCSIDPPGCKVHLFLGLFNLVPA